VHEGPLLLHGLVHWHRHTGHHRHWEEEEDPDPQRELSTRGVLSGPGSFSGETIGLSHSAINLNDGGVVGIGSGFGGHCGDAISLSMISVGGTGSTSRREVGDVSYEERRDGRHRLEHTSRGKRRGATGLEVDVRARVAKSGPMIRTSLIP
jgi:hypothetical protein